MKNRIAKLLVRPPFSFAKEEKDGALDAVPDGYVVAETKNGLPVLKKAS